MYAAPENWRLSLVGVIVVIVLVSAWATMRAGVLPFGLSGLGEEVRRIMTMKGSAPPVDEAHLTRKDAVLFLCIALFVACLMISSVTASKLWGVSLFGYFIAIPVGTSLFAITFPCTDVVAEIWGRTYSMYVVFLGFIARLISLGFYSFAVRVTPVPYYRDQDAYATVLGSSGIIIIAGIIAYLVSQANDVFLFHLMKRRDVGRNLLWKRNNLSTFTSQFLDSFIFVVIAFGPFGLSLGSKELVSIIAGQVIVKWIIALLDTPFVYLLRNWAEGRRVFDLSG
ncbi:MAG: VUT family protein [Chloroflexi bacterium]|nr:MAG: VUT family protein [Chloroflexota bacterium]